MIYVDAFISHITAYHIQGDILSNYGGKNFGQQFINPLILKWLLKSQWFFFIKNWGLYFKLFLEKSLDIRFLIENIKLEESAQGSEEE